MNETENYPIVDSSVSPTPELKNRAEAFLADYAEVCRKHKMSLSYDGGRYPDEIRLEDSNPNFDADAIAKLDDYHDFVVYVVSWRKNIEEEMKKKLEDDKQLRDLFEEAKRLAVQKRTADFGRFQDRFMKRGFVLGGQWGEAEDLAFVPMAKTGEQK